MRRWAVGMVLLAAAGMAHGQTQVTTGHQAMACQSAEQYADVIAARRAGDRASFTAMFTSGRCTQLPAGRVITVLDGPAGERDLMLVLFEGRRWWVERARLDYGLGHRH